MPAARPAIDTLTCSVAGALPLAGETASHDALVAEVNDSDPVPPLATLNAAGVGFVPPATAENDRVDGVVTRMRSELAPADKVIDSAPSG